MDARKIIFFAMASFLCSSCGGDQARIKSLPVMRQPIKMMEGGEMWEKWSFSLLIEGPSIHALTGEEKGLKLTSMRMDGQDSQRRLVLEKDRAWWDVSEEQLQARCGEEEVFEEKTRLVLDKRGIIKQKSGYLVAFGAESVLSCASSRKQPFSEANYFLALFDNKWNLKAGPWKGNSGESVLAFIPVRRKDRPGLFWLGRKEIGFALAPETLEGEGERFSRSISMNLAPEWGRLPVLASLQHEGDWILAAAYAEEAMAEQGKNSVTVLCMPPSDSGDVSIARLRTTHSPTAVDMQPIADRLVVLWAVTGLAPPAGTMSAIYRADLTADGSVGAPRTVFEKKDMAGSAFLIKKLCFFADKKKFAVGWVYDAQAMDGMEERIGLFVSTSGHPEKGQVYKYPLKFGQRGIKNIHITPSGSQYIIIWEERGLHQIRTAISSIY